MKVVLFIIFIIGSLSTAYSQGYGQVGIAGKIGWRYLANAIIYVDGKKRGMTGVAYTTLTIQEGSHEIIIYDEIDEYSYYEGRLNIFVGADSSALFDVNVKKELTKLGVEKIEKEAKKEALEKEKQAEELQKIIEYRSMIQALVYKYFNPPENSQGNTVEAVLELGAFGKFLDFKILTYSSNDALNKECDNMKNRLEHVPFPDNPDNKSVKLMIILASE